MIVKSAPLGRGKSLWAMAVLATLAVSASCGRAADTRQKLIPVGARKAAPDFSITAIDGRKLTLRQYRGKVVLLDFWAVACGGCKVEIAWYVSFNRKYQAKGSPLEGLWAQDDALWVKAPSRRIHFEDMVARRKAELLTSASARPALEEKDFACYTDDEIRAFAFDVRKLFLTERAKHLAICSRCQRRLEYWSGLVENFDRARPLQEGRADA